MPCPIPYFFYRRLTEIANIGLLRASIRKCSQRSTKRVMKVDWGTIQFAQGEHSLVQSKLKSS